MKRLIGMTGLMISLWACASGPVPLPSPKLPYQFWYVGLVAPKHMEVWVETVDVLDQRRLPFFHVTGGVASYTGKSQGWHNGVSGGMPVNNVDLPERLFLRWQSLVEPQAYKLRIPIPQWVRDEMVRPEKVYCQGAKEWINDYRKVISLGMAPGGIVKVWLGGPCLSFKEVGRYQAEIEPRGPFLSGRGIYYREPKPEAKAWIEKNGIPYGSW
ncbi:DUF2931 family protein [Pseudomonas sp. NPDC090201]|uniref:DUF2931 family protein n=1 Tax=Pseudomonas sp. NPDC090201 TaxID=3364475 RepID=UPI003806AE30